MNSFKSLLFLAILLIGNKSFAQNKETRKVSSFNELEVGGSFDLVIEQGDENIITIESSGIDPEKIITEVNGDVLEVHLEEGNYRNFNATVYIRYKNLEEIKKSGSGNLRSESDFNASEYRLSNSGSGNTSIRGNIKAEQLSIDVSGSGNVELASLETENFDLSMSGSGNFDVSSGLATRFSINKSGSGDLQAFGLKSDRCSVIKSGSGNINVSAEKEIEARMSGSGDINYRGNARINRVKHSGSGEINRR